MAQWLSAPEFNPLYQEKEKKDRKGKKKRRKQRKKKNKESGFVLNSVPGHEYTACVCCHE